MIYLPKFNGFLNDVADIDFLRSDGVAFRFDKASATSLNGTRNTTPIQGGAYKYPIGYLEGDDSLEVTFTSQEFDQELFEMAQSTTATVKDVGVLESGWYAVETG